MVVWNKSNSQIVLKNSPIFLTIGIVAIFMGLVGIRVILGLLPFEEGYIGGDIFGLIFMCVWTFVTFSMSIASLNICIQRVIINNEGVCTKSWFHKTKLTWSEIEDWGLSYCGQTRGEGNTYYLYFSKNQQKTKNTCSKKLKGSMIKTNVMGEEYSEVVNIVVPFCLSRTDVNPFIGEDKFHLL